MQVYHGKSVCGGIAIGKVSVYGRPEGRVEREEKQNQEAEICRYREAAGIALEQLDGLYEKALRQVGEAEASIFEIHRMMLKDSEFQGSIEDIIHTLSVNAEYAVARTAEDLEQKFQACEDAYMRGRAADIEDISRRLLAILQGREEERIQEKEPVILLADDLAPSQTVQLDKSQVLAFVTARGSLNSHTAILARTMGIPALVGTDIPLDESLDGRPGIVDGAAGMLYIDPDRETCARMRKALEEEKEKKELFRTLIGKENLTLDGQSIQLHANIGSIKDLDMVLQNDADGIGLFRSEFLYLERNDFPTEEEQFRIYRTVAEAMGKKRAIIRTLDIGADKQCAYFGMEKEENPALGCRAIRLCLTRTEIFKTQLRALLRASAYGRLAIMYPMITSVKEVRRIREIEEEAKAELEARGLPQGHPEQGIMIETPAAAMISDLLAREVDFFSIGTNDLTQYVLALDRQNQSLDEFRDTHHPAVLRMIELTVENAHRAGIWAGICGELAADPELTGEFLAMGVDELSVAPERILPLRKAIRETDVSEYIRIR
ncbi:phosphoenolpyruvate--protein phosphotransferase [uncultured Acetatifactor sp.]|jgi:phosphotransferase system enzyme I (PtsI)|uniref:phosphoenolpyruvate--protein phosphotransferase n=1 Tax=uncultured Acetatifactor sp. TaxID=1671927 RepID=UPI0026080991|nr:phosphoenolpyruvate--protein phosphotransferase [uncultured Acetatifactor sp.]